MKKIILDENLPHRLRLHFPEYTVVTVVHMGWAGVQNGKLVELMDGVFDVFLTADKKLRYQQNLSGRKITIIELPLTRFELLEPMIPRINDAIGSSAPGQYLQIQ